MAEIPLRLKPEVGRFIHRANQLRQVKPTITYYCEYYAANQILQKKLHQGDQDALNFTMDLMSRLEQYKSAHENDDVLVDNTVGKIYVEEFAHETFNRGEKVLRASRVTRNTADTFDAAATFFELGKIWGDIDEEVQKKIKFAKWNAARILKAIKEGQDPNESNPKIEPETDLVGGVPGFSGQEGMASPRTGMEVGPTGVTGPGAPDVEGSMRQDLATMSLGEPSPAPVPPKIPLGPDPGLQGQPPAPQNYYAPSAPSAPTPPSPLSAPSIDGANTGDPIVPSPYSHSASPAPQVPFAAGPPSAGPASGYSSVPPSVPPSSHSAVPPSFPLGAPISGIPGTVPGPGVPPPHMPHHMAPPPQASHPQPHPYSSPQQAPSQWHPARPPIPPPSAPPPHTNPYGTPYAPHQTPNPSGAWQPPPIEPGVDINKAQKHAKFAQSALNFDDVPTAVKELRLALAALGQH